MNGTNRHTGRPLAGEEHLRQSVVDILTTPLGNRVMRRDYGSRLFQLLDGPVNSGMLVELYAATAEALDKWEPRLQLTQVTLDSMEQGHLILNVEGRYLPDGREIKLEGLIL